MRTHARGYVPYRWREWITSVDVMPVRGFAAALMMRPQQALAFHAAGYLPPSKSYARSLRSRSSSSACPSWLNSVVSQQLGARDAAWALCGATTATRRRSHAR